MKIANSLVGAFGVMALVFLATEIHPRRQVAIKVPHRERVDRPEDADAYLTEARTVANLDHPNIARLIDGGATDDGLPYIVMEYIEGAKITDFCREGRLSTEQILRLFLPVCSAVEHAHRNFVVHRDIKPGNILVTKDGMPKLLDFGISKLLDTELPAKNETAVAGVRLLTPDYASPEQIRGDAVTTASDVYSLGDVLYELLTGVTPHQFPKRNLTEVERVVSEEDVRRLCTEAGWAGDAIRVEVDRTGLTHMATELFAVMAGVRMIHVPYKSTGVAMPEILAGQTQVMVAGMLGAQPFFSSGRLRALGVTTAKRWPSLPNIPAIAEALPGYDTGTYYGMFLPKGTPPAIVNRLNAEVNKILQDGGIKNTLEAQGMAASGGTPAAFAARVKKEYNDWVKVVREAKLKIE